MLVDVCFHGMVKKYRVFLENLSFSSFPNLMEPRRRTNESVCRSSKFITSVKPSQAPISRLEPKKRLIFVALNEAKEVRPFSSKRSAFEKRGSNIRFYHPPLRSKDNCRTLGTMSEGLSRPPPLCRPFSICSGPKGRKLIPLPSKKGHLSTISKSIQKDV